MAASSVVSSSASPLSPHPVPSRRRDSAISVATVPSSLPNTAATPGDVATPSNSLTTTTSKPSLDATENSSAARLQSETSTQPAGHSDTPSVHVQPDLYELLYGTGWAALTRPFARQYAQVAKQNVDQAKQKHQEQVDQRKMLEAQQYPGEKPILLPPEKKLDEIDLESLYTDSSREKSGPQGISLSSLNPSDSSLGSTQASGTGERQRARLVKFMHGVRKVTHWLMREPGPTSHVPASPETADARNLPKDDIVTAQASKRPGPLKRIAMWLTGADAGRGMP